jgi:hypothetical protein
MSSRKNREEVERIEMENQNGENVVINELNAGMTRKKSILKKKSSAMPATTDDPNASLTTASKSDSSSSKKVIFNNMDGLPSIKSPEVPGNDSKVRKFAN